MPRSRTLSALELDLLRLALQGLSRFGSGRGLLGLEMAALIKRYRGPWVLFRTKAKLAKGGHICPLTMLLGTLAC